MTTRSILCLPIGSDEQRGPHLPVHTDTVLAEGFPFAAVERWGESYDLAPSEVSLKRLSESYDPDPALAKGAEQFIFDRGVTWPWTSEDPAISSHGLIGDARAANEELGQRIVGSAVEAYGTVFADLLKRG